MRAGPRRDAGAVPDPRPDAHSDVEAASRGARTELSVIDVLRADIPRLHRALTGDPFHDNLVLRLGYPLFQWIEHHGRYPTKVVYCPPLPLLWSFLPGDGRPATIIHKSYLHQLWRERSLAGRAALLLSVLLLWPLINVATVTWSTAINGAAIRKRYGKSILGQVFEQARLSAVHNILSPWYYTFDLHGDDRRRHAAEYIHRFETKGGLYRLLKRGRFGSALSPLQDKVLFAARCHEHGVRVLPVLAFADRGEIRSESGPAGSLPLTNLFFKPTLGRGGEGAERWDYVDVGRYKDDAGAVLSDDRLRLHLQRLSMAHPYLVQPRATNHASLLDLTNGALSTVRILTCRNDEGRPEATDAVFRMAVGANTVVDNFHAGGIAAAIDMATGRLGPATDMGLRPERGWCDVHPDTGARISGRMLPFWQDVVNLAVRAHGAFSDRVIIGWDVAILNDGPYVIEGNGAPDLDIHQRCSRRPLGAGRLGTLLAGQVKQALAGSPIAADAALPSNP